MYRPVLKLLIIQQFALLLKSLFVIFSTFLIYGQSCNGHQKLIFSFLYKLPLIVDESHSNFFALPNLLYMRFRLTIEPFSEFVCFLQRLFSTCLMGVLCNLKLSTKGRTIRKVEITLCKHYWHRAWSFNFGIGIFEVSPKCLFLTNAGQRVSQILNLILLSVEILSLKQVLTYFVRESFTEQLTSLFFVWIHLICLC